MFSTAIDVRILLEIDNVTFIAILGQHDLWLCIFHHWFLLNHISYVAGQHKIASIWL